MIIEKEIIKTLQLPGCLHSGCPGGPPVLLAARNKNSEGVARNGRHWSLKWLPNDL